MLRTSGLSRFEKGHDMPKTKSRFTPHAIIETERTRPSSLWMCAVLGVETLLRIDFPKGLPSACFMRFALSKVPASVPTFGRPISVVLNYRADFAVRYSLDGAVIEVLDAPATVGAATLVLDDPAATREDRVAFASLVGIETDNRPTVH